MLFHIYYIFLVIISIKVMSESDIFMRNIYQCILALTKSKTRSKNGFQKIKRFQSRP